MYMYVYMCICVYVYMYMYTRVPSCNARKKDETSRRSCLKEPLERNV